MKKTVSILVSALTLSALMGLTEPATACSIIISNPAHAIWTDTVPPRALIPLDTQMFGKLQRDPKTQALTVPVKISGMTQDGQLFQRALKEIVGTKKADRYAPALYFRPEEPFPEGALLEEAHIGDKTHPLSGLIRVGGKAPPAKLSGLPELKVRYGSWLHIPGTCGNVDFARVEMPPDTSADILFNFYSAQTREALLEQATPTKRFLLTYPLSRKNQPDRSALYGTVGMFGKPGHWIAVAPVNAEGVEGARSAPMQVPHKWCSVRG